MPLETELSFPPIFGQIKQWMIDHPRPTYYLRHVNPALGFRGNSNDKYLEIIHQAARDNGVEQRGKKTKHRMSPDVFERVCQSVALVRGIQTIGDQTLEQFTQEVDQVLAQKENFSIKELIRITGRSKNLGKRQSTWVHAKIEQYSSSTPLSPLPKDLSRTICLGLGPIGRTLLPAERSKRDRMFAIEIVRTYTIDDDEFSVLGQGIRALHNRGRLAEVGIARLNQLEMNAVNKAADEMKRLMEDPNLDLDDEIKKRLEILFSKLPHLFSYQQEFLSSHDPKNLILLQIILRAKAQGKSVNDLHKAFKEVLMET